MVAYIGVNYKTPENAIRWIKSIQITNPESLIVVVDNSAEYNKNLSREIDDLASSNIKYIDTEYNLGYFNGAAYAYHMLEEVRNCNWIAVCNVDIELQTHDVENILIKYNSSGAVAPSIISETTKFDKNPYRLSRPSKMTIIIKKFAFSNTIFSWFYNILSDIRNVIIRKKHISHPKCDEGTAIYLPYGACIFFSKEYFRKGCKIDFPMFLFGEELFVAEQCKKANLQIVYVPSIRFLNHEHASTSKLHKRFIRKNNYKAIKFILNEFYK